MKILKRTPRTEMRYEALLTKLVDLWEDLAQSTGEDRHVMDLALTQFAQLSARVSLDGEEADFELALPGDDVETIRAKFLAFLDTDTMDVVDKAIGALRKLDIEPDLITGPAPLPEDAEKKQ